MLFLITGRGKGKTSIAIATVIRSLVAGKKIGYIQFMKSTTNAVSKLQEILNGKYINNFEFYSFGGKSFVEPSNPKKEDFEFAKKGWQKAKEFFKSKDLIVLDELNVVLLFKLLDKNLVLKELKNYVQGKTNKPRPYKWPIILITGIDADEEFVKIADMVSEIKDVKHPFREGFLATKGIDF